MALDKYNNYSVRETPTKAQTRRKNNNELVQLAKAACSKQQGMAEIGEGYWIVDSKKYKVVARN